MPYLEWTNDYLGECLCWDNSTADWCSEDVEYQCADLMNEISSPAWVGLMWGVTIIVVTLMQFAVLGMSKYLRNKTKEYQPSIYHTLGKTGFYCTRALGLFAVLAGFAVSVANNVFANDLFFELNRVNNTITVTTSIIRGSGTVFQQAATTLSNELNVLVPSTVESKTTRWMNEVNDQQVEFYETYKQFLIPAIIWPLCAWSFLSWLGTLHRKPTMTRIMFAISSVVSIALTILHVLALLITYVNVIICTDYDNVQSVGLTIIEARFKNESSAIYDFYDLSQNATTRHYCTSIDSPLIKAKDYFVITLPDCHGDESIKRIIESESYLRLTTSGRGECTGSCSIQSCSELCLQGSAVKNISIAVVDSWDKIHTSLAIIETIGFQLAELTAFSNLFTSLKAPICTPIFFSNVYIVIWTSLLVFFYTCIIVYLWYSSTHLAPRLHSRRDSHQRVDSDQGYISDQDILLESLETRAAASYGATKGLLGSSRRHTPVS